MRLQARDIQLFQHLHTYQFMTVDHLKRRVFLKSQHPSIIRRRLRKLEYGGYIGIRHLYDGRGKQTGNVYFLRPPAYDHLDIAYRRRSIPKDMFLHHTLSITTVQMQMEDHLQKHKEIELVQFQTERDTYMKNNKPVKVIFDKITTTGGKRVGITPDAVMTLRHRKEKYKVTYFIECDRSSETIRQLKKKFDQYAAYSEHPNRFIKKYGCTIPKFLVLFITTNEKRIAAVQRNFSMHKGMDLFLLTATYSLEQAKDLYADIWERRNNENFALFE